MYDNKDYETILADMCARVEGSINTGEGTLVNFALAPAAAELEEMYNNLEVADLNGSALTCDREHLIILGEENNIPIKTATKAKWIAKFNVNFEVGERFEAGDLTYISIRKLEEKKYILECETEGTEGNTKPDDELLPIEFIDEYEKGDLIELVEGAEDDEETEIYRARYLEERKQEYTLNGNRADYKKFIKKMVGVGGVKQERVKKGHKRIDTYIISSTWGKPSDDIVAEVQQAVDPKENQGDGEGKAPFWHVVDIYPVKTEEINISANFELSAGTTFEMVLSKIEEAVAGYFVELGKTWEETGKNGLIVRVLKVAETMANVEGVIDVKNLLLNGTEDNISLDKNSIPVKGVITNAA